MHSQVLPRAPSGTAAGKHMAMITAGDKHRYYPAESSDSFPSCHGEDVSAGCNSHYPVC